MHKPSFLQMAGVFTVLLILGIVSLAIALTHQLVEEFSAQQEIERSRTH